MEKNVIHEKYKHKINLNIQVNIYKSSLNIQNITAGLVFPKMLAISVFERDRHIGTIGQTRQIDAKAIGSNSSQRFAMKLNV